MIELEYFLKQENTAIHVYQLIQFSSEDPWRVVLDGELLGSLEKIKGQWKQLDGENFSDQFLNEIITFIDQQHFNYLPSALISRWDNLIQDVVAKSDQEYLVVCKADISFKSFESIFSKFVSVLLKDEWPVRFQVFNHDFSEDFTVLAKPVIFKKNTVGWD